MVKRNFSIILAKPRGFCAGVDRAIDIIRMALNIYGKPVYMRHAIVHNQQVVNDLEGEGAIFVETTDEIPEGAVTVFSAHGVSPKVKEEAKKRRLRVIDATCPLVTKVHLEAIKFAREGYSIILIGHRGHVEVEGTMGEAPHKVQLIENADDVDRLSIQDPGKVAVLTQTTLSVDDTRDIIERLKERFPELREPSKEDICYATQNRQDAVKELAQLSDIILVIGSPTSSNSNRLKEVAEKQGVKAYLVEKSTEINPLWFENTRCVGITAGASTPEKSVKEVVDYLFSLGAVNIEEFTVREETISFTLPQELTEKKRGQI